jgi:hypothetical protein
MENQTEWYTSISRDLNSYRGTWNRKDIQKYKIDLLLRVAKRVDFFAVEEAECRDYKNEIGKMVTSLKSVPDIAKERRNYYLKSIDRMVNHLHKKHHLMSEGQNIGNFLSLGFMIGLLVGIFMGNGIIGLFVGAAAGAGIGYLLELKAKSSGRMI